MAPLPALSEITSLYEEAVNARDADKLRALLALDDPRFSEIEDHIDLPFGAERARAILDWIRTAPDSGYRVSHRNAQSFMLSENAGYIVARTEWRGTKGSGTGRVTFVCIRADDGWKILHGHWSNSPE